MKFVISVNVGIEDDEWLSLDKFEETKQMRDDITGLIGRSYAVSHELLFEEIDLVLEKFDTEAEADLSLNVNWKYK